MWEITMQVDDDWLVRFATLDVGESRVADDGERFGTPEEALAAFRLKAAERRRASGRTVDEKRRDLESFRQGRQHDWAAAEKKARKRGKKAALPRKDVDAVLPWKDDAREAEEREAKAEGLCSCEACCAYRREKEPLRALVAPVAPAMSDMAGVWAGEGPPPDVSREAMLRPSTEGAEQAQPSGINGSFNGYRS